MTKTINLIYSGDIYPLLFVPSEGALYYHTWLLQREYQQVLLTGRLDGKAICAIQVFSTNYLYDFILQRMGVCPFREIHLIFAKQYALPYHRLLFI